MNLEDWTPTVRWSRPETDAEGTDLLIVLHGFGADENDLFPLTEHLPKNFTVAAVQAPKALPAHFGGYCWFPISEHMTSDPADVYQAVVGLNQWVQDRREHYRTVSLLGFSQGMAMATSLLRINPEHYACTVGLSGFVITEQAVAHTIKGESADPDAIETLLALFDDHRVAEVLPEVFWGRDVHDPIIPGQMANDAGEWLSEHTTLSAEVYSGIGHGVHPEEVKDFTKVLIEAVEAHGAEE